jgi:hypothetical protein
LDRERSGTEALMQQTEEGGVTFPKFWQDENLNQRIELQKALFSVLVLTAVEVELVVGNAGPSDDEITMYLRDSGGGVLDSKGLSLTTGASALSAFRGRGRHV